MKKLLPVLLLIAGVALLTITPARSASHLNSDGVLVDNSTGATVLALYGFTTGTPHTNNKGFLVDDTGALVVTGISGGGSGDALTTDPLSQFASTTSAQLATVLSDENGSGKAIFSAGTLAVASGKTLTASNTLTLTGTDASSVAFGAGGTVLYSGGALGTPSSGTLTNGTGLPLTSGVTGTLPIANGGTGTTSGVKTPINAYCGGTIGTANATTYVLIPAVSGASVTCTNTSHVDMPMPFACTAKNMYVNLGTAGAQAGSGIVTLKKAGSNTIVTCTTGTSTSCNDTTHTVDYAAGDTWFIGVFTGQASDTIANVRVAFECDPI